VKWARLPQFVALLTWLACEPRRAPPALGPLGGDAARVGDVAIPVSLVVQVARSRRALPRRALDALVEDALLAQAARAGGLEREPDVGWASTRTMARMVPERLVDEARARGAPTDDEIAAVHVVHAVVGRSPSVSQARAWAVADAISQAISGARDDEDFETRARQVPHLGVQVTVERLPAFDLTGRAADGSELDAGFVAAAFSLLKRGETSEVVETPFGLHVIRLMDRVAPDSGSIDRRRGELAGDVVGLRVRARVDAIVISAAADALMTEAAASIP
jgi:hypothetical protein